MTDTGKVDESFFAEYIFPRLGAARDDVRLGPTYGVDFGVVDVDGTALVTATDPISILRGLGWAKAGKFALQFALADVAVSGLVPSHLAISFAFPSETTDEQFAELWGAIHEECEELGTSVVTGHTGRYPGAEYPWVGSATVMAVGDYEDVVRPDGARPGDRILVTKGPAIETTGLLSSLFPDRIDVDESTLSVAQARLDDVPCVRDATTAAAAGPVTAMHDATEGGLYGAFFETAGSAGVRFEIESEAIPVAPGVRETCAALGIDPWTATTSGSLVITVAESGVDAVVSALESRGTPVGVAGRVVEGSGVAVDGEELSPPESDSSWAAYERLAGGDE